MKKSGKGGFKFPASHFLYFGKFLFKKKDLKDLRNNPKDLVDGCFLDTFFITLIYTGVVGLNNSCLGFFLSAGRG